MAILNSMRKTCQHPLTCGHDEFDYFLKPAVNSLVFQAKKSIAILGQKR